MNTWYFETVADRHGAEMAARLHGGLENDYSGTFALKYFLARQAQSVIEERMVADTADIGEAFNEVSDGWPQELRALLAALEVQRDEGPDDYLQECEFLGRAFGWLDGDTLSLSLDDIETAELVYAVDPFADDRLSDEEAELVAWLRAAGGDESELDWDEIVNVEDFRWWFEETGDVDQSMRVHAFGQDADPRIVQHAHSPEDWRELDYENIERGECIQCANELHLIETPLAEEGRTEWVHANGDDIGATRIGYGEEYYTQPSETSGRIALLCSYCKPEWDSRQKTTYIVKIGDTVTEFQARAPIAKHTGGDSYTDIDPAAFEEDIANEMFIGGQQDWYTVEPTSRARTDVLSGRLSEDVEMMRNMEGTLIAQVEQDGYCQIHFRGDEPHAAKSAKQMIESPSEVLHV